MTTQNLQQPSNLNSTGSNPTTRYFNNYFTSTAGISTDVNESLLSYFEQQTGSVESAKILVQSVINTATQQRQDPMTILAEFQKLNAGELNAMLTLYLNSTRINTSFLGIKNQPKPNPFVARSILP
jgi:hypothetical protein